MIIGMTRKLASAAAAVVVLAVAGCGDGTAQPPSTPSSPAAASSSASPAPSSTPSPTRRSLSTETDARQLLLTSQDLGPEWRSYSGGADAPGEQRNSNPDCSGVERDLYTKGNARVVVTAGWMFSGAVRTESIDHIVKVHPGGGAADEIAGIRANVGRCRTWQEGGVAPGYAFTMSMESAKAPQVGDEAFAWRHSAKTSLVPDVATTYSVVLRVGDITSLIRYTPGTLMPSSTAEQHLREVVGAAVARAEKVLQPPR